MTVTTDEPSDTTAEDRWEQLEDQLEKAREHLRAETGSALAAIDACLARLGTLRGELTDPWIPKPSSATTRAPTTRDGGRRPGGPGPTSPAMNGTAIRRSNGGPAGNSRP